MSRGKCGRVALVGRPNVGKSTLLNALVGEHLAIVTHKAQTTRQRVTGIVNRDEGQAIFVDTPGLHRRRDHGLNRRLNRIAADTWRGVDVVVMLVDAGRITEEDRMVLKRLKSGSIPRILAFNKIDCIGQRGILLERTAELTAEADFDAVVYLSASRQEGLDDLLDEVFSHLPEGAPVYDADQFTDCPQRFLAAELIREQLMLQLHEEIPYELTVVVERFEQRGGRIEIDALIIVGNERHKGMVIGRQGSVLKRVGTKARRSIGELLDARVHLELHVRTRRDWMNDERALDEYGYSS